MDPGNGRPKSLGKVEQLKEKILQMKKEIAKKQLKLRKSKRAARMLDRNNVDSIENGELKSNGGVYPGNASAELKKSSSSDVKLDDDGHAQSDSSKENKSLEPSSSPPPPPPESSLMLDADEKTLAALPIERLLSNNEESGAPHPAADETPANASPSASLRRSSRVSRESRVIASGDFLVGSHVRKRRASVDSSELIEPSTADAPIGNKERTIFPKFPNSTKMRNDCADFTLPVDEFAALKLQVLKANAPSTVGQPKTNPIADIQSAESNTKDDDNDDADVVVVESDKDFLLKKVCRLPEGGKKQRQPIQFIHCGQLTATDRRQPTPSILRVVVTIQRQWICTYVQESESEKKIDNNTAWRLVKRAKLDLESCQKANMHGVERRHAVATVCIHASKDKQRLTFAINVCDSRRKVMLRQMTIEPDFNVMTGSLLSTCCPFVRRKASGGGGGDDDDDRCEVVVANVWARTSRLKRVSLDGDLAKVLAERTLTEVDDNLNSLVTIDGLESGLLGTSNSTLFIWDRSTGDIIKVIKIKDARFNCRSCIFCKAESGLLFIALFNQPAINDECSLFVVNPNKARWKRMVNFSLSSTGTGTVAPNRQSRRRRIKASDKDDEM